MGHKLALTFAAVMWSGVAAPAHCDRECLRVAAIVDPLIQREMAKTGIPGAAFVFVERGRVVYERGYGVSDVAAKMPVEPKRTVWPIASISKVVTALGAMQLVGAGKIDLDSDVNRYLKRVQNPAQGYGPLTLRHLLSHTSGLDELPGRQFEGKSPPDLATFLRTRLVRYRAPGQYTAYSSYGIALTGVLIEDVSGMSYADYVERHVFRPAGMIRARVMRKIGDERGVATPYALEDGKATVAAREWYVTTPSSSIAASADDMGKLLMAMLGSLLPSPMTGEMLQQQSTNHPELPGWGLGVQLDRVNGVRIAEHGGDIAGFSALFVLMPDKQGGFFIVHHGEGGNLRFKVKDALLDGLYPDPNPQVAPAPDPKNAAALGEYAGRYISTLACRTCKDEQPTFEVTAQLNGTLSLWGQTWIPLKRDLFIRDDGKRLLGFTRNSAGRIVSVTGGSWRVADRLD